MASYFSSTLISSPLLPALRGVFLCGTLRQNVAPHRYTVATSVNMWQLPEQRGNYTVTGPATAVYLWKLPHSISLLMLCSLTLQLKSRKGAANNSCCIKLSHSELHLHGVLATINSIKELYNCFCKQKPILAI